MMKKIKNNKIEIKGLSKKEVEIIAWLEFNKKYFFSVQEIEHFFKDKTKRYKHNKRTCKEKRIFKLNRTKYYLVPIKAKSGAWAEEPFVVIDEVMNGENYYIGGWGAANYWRLTDQIPFRYDVYTTRRQGKFRVLNTEIIFHRSTKDNAIKKAATIKIQEHDFKIINKKESKKWMKLRD